MTPRVLWLSAGVQAAVPIAQPRLDQLSEQIGQSTSLCMLDGASIGAPLALRDLGLKKSDLDRSAENLRPKIRTIIRGSIE